MIFALPWPFQILGLLVHLKNGSDGFFNTLRKDLNGERAEGRYAKAHFEKYGMFPPKYYADPEADEETQKQQLKAAEEKLRKIKESREKNNS
jgi:hypothetical protein